MYLYHEKNKNIVWDGLYEKSELKIPAAFQLPTDFYIFMRVPTLANMDGHYFMCCCCANARFLIFYKPIIYYIT